MNKNKPWKDCEYITKHDYCKLLRRVCLMDECNKLKVEGNE